MHIPIYIVIVYPKKSNKTPFKSGNLYFVVLLAFGWHAVTPYLSLLLEGRTGLTARV